MPTLPATSVLMTPDEYLAAEEQSDVKHEYIGGYSYAMRDCTTAHNTIALNLATALTPHLRGTKYRFFGMDIKLALQWSGEDCFYYPDAMIVGETATFGPNWCKGPTVVFEVVSQSTRQSDEREKWVAYFQTPSLDAYVRIEEDRQLVVVDRRTTPNTWNRETLNEPEDMLSLPICGVEFPIKELYDRLGF